MNIEAGTHAKMLVQIRNLTWERYKRSKNILCMTKQIFAKPPQEGNLGVGQIRIYPRSTKTGLKSKNPE